MVFWLVVASHLLTLSEVFFLTGDKDRALLFFSLASLSVSVSLAFSLRGKT